MVAFGIVDLTIRTRASLSKWVMDGEEIADIVRSNFL
jgi:hypothetical protein